MEEDHTLAQSSFAPPCCVDPEFPGSLPVPDFAPALRWCIRTSAIPIGISIHARIVSIGFDRTSAAAPLANLILQMYATCGSRFPHARRMFDRMRIRNSFSVNIMIGAYARANGFGKHALELFRLMQMEGLNPTKFTFVSVLSACANMATFKEAKLVHLLVVVKGVKSDVVIGTSLVNAFGKCGRLKEARMVFDGMLHRNVITWNSLISAYAQTGRNNDVNAMFVNTNGKSGLLQEVKQVFDNMPHRKVHTQNSLISAIAQTGHSNDANAALQYSMASAHAQERHLKDAHVVPGNSLIAQIGDREDGHIIPGSSFIGQIDHSKEALLISRSPIIAEKESIIDAHTISSYVIPQEEHSNDAHIIDRNSHIGVHAQIGHSKDALDLFQQMIVEGYKPNRITFLGILEACGNLGSPENGMVIHGFTVASGLDSDISVGTALLNMYGKCNSLKDSRSVFEKMNQRDLVSWNAMLTAYARKGQAKEVLDLHSRMESESIKVNKVTLLCILEACACVSSLEKGRSIHQCIVESGLNSDLAVNNALIHMYGKCSSPSEARAVFDQLCRRNVISWTSMISVYASNGYSTEALELFWRMDVQPNKITFTTVLDACASLGSLEHGRAVHRCISSGEWESDISVATSLVNMYGKCGSPDDARLVFNRIADCDLVLWNSMIGAYAHNGHGKEALEIFDQMLRKGVKPSPTTFISVLSACSHAGLLQEGRHYFSTMIKKYGLRPSAEHYVCMIDLLGRAGYLDEAEEMVANLPDQTEVVAWLTLLGRES